MMPDREKVIKALEKFVGIGSCKWSPHRIDESWMELQHLLTDALALLKDDETRIQYLKDHIAMCKEEVERLHKEQEVVRCKDCIYGEHEKNESTGTEWIYCAHHRENRPNEWFCASGSPTIKQEGRKME